MTDYNIVRYTQEGIKMREEIFEKLGITDETSIEELKQHVLATFMASDHLETLFRVEGRYKWNWKLQGENEILKDALAECENEHLALEIGKARNQISKLKQEITSQRENNHQRNLELDAMHYIWCDGGCGGGAHRFTENNLDQGVIDAAIRNTSRLVTWWVNHKYRMGNFKSFLDPEIVNAKPSGKLKLMWDNALLRLKIWKLERENK